MAWIIKVRLFVALILLGAALVGCDLSLNPKSLHTDVVRLPISRSAISFDDISYDAKIKRVVVPAAESGTLALVDPITRGAQIIQGFSAQANPANPGIGATSATSAKDLIFALDRSAKVINIIEPRSGNIIGSAPTQDTPDLIRFVSATSELWVTERSLEQIEYFKVKDGPPVTVEKAGVIPVPNGPVSLVIDQTNGLAFTNKPKTGTTLEFQVFTHNQINEWGNGCSRARGLALDVQRRYLFVACNEGKLVMMDITSGLQITSQNYGGGLDFIAYNPSLQHVYLPSGASGVVAIFAVTSKAQVTPTKKGQKPAPTVTPTVVLDFGEDITTPTPGPKISLVRLGTADTSAQARCVTTDEYNNIWVCDPEHAQLFLIRDTFDAGGS
jgi:hypothetical protein